MKLEYSDYVVGCRIKDRIILNPKLDKYPKLKERILEHENEHTDGLTLKDLAIDTFGNHLGGVKKEYYSFIWSHPKTWVSFLPITRVNGTWTLDLIMLSIVGFAVVMAWVVATLI